MFFGGLLVLALIAALVAPGFIEWENYKAGFEKQAGRILGQKVEVLGEARARLLPLPRITFTDVRVGARADGEAMMVVDRFRVDAELAPLLKGEIIIVDMELQSPKVNIAIGKNGVVDWTDRKSGGVNPDDVILEKVTIRDGSIRLHNVETDQSFEAEQINVDISARTLAGPWRINGDLVLKGEKADIKINTGRLQDKGTISARLNVQPHAHPYAMELAGPIGMVNGALNYKGNFKLKAVHPKKNVAGGKPGLVFPYSALPVGINGRFDARPDALKVPEFTLAVGDKDDPYSITGTAQAAFGDRSLFKIVAEGQQIDIDRLGKITSASSKRPSLGERLQVLKNIAELVPVPPAEGLVSLYLPAIIAGDTVIREVGVDILPKRDGWQLSNLEAGLPGRTNLQAHGFLTLGEEFGFKGQLLMASKQPSGFAGWLKGDVDEAIRRLPNAGFSAKVLLSEKRVLLQKLEIVLGKTRLNGALERVQRSNSRPLLTTILDGNNIDVETLQALFLLFVSDQDGSRIADHDMDIKLLGENFSAFGISAKLVTASLKLLDNHLGIDQLEIGDLAGAKISVQGQIADALNSPDGRLKVLVAAKHAAGLLNLLSKFVEQNLLLTNLLEEPYLVDDLDLQADIKVSANGDTTDLTLDLVGQAGGTGIDLDLRLAGSLANPLLADTEMDLVLTNAQPHVLLGQLAVPVLPLDVNGELQISASAKGAPAKEFDAEFAVSLDGAVLSGKGEVDQISDGAWRSRFDVRLKTPDIDPLLLLSGYFFPGMEEGSSVDLTAQLTSLGPWISAKSVEGSIGGQSIQAKLRLDRGAEPRPKIVGEMSLEQLSLSTIAGLVIGEQAIARGLKWSKIAFGLPVLQGLDADIELEVDAVDLETSGLGYTGSGKNLVGRFELNDGDVALREARADWLDGRLAGEISFAHSQNNVLMSSTLSISNGAVSEIIWKSDDKPVIEGEFDLNLNAEGSGANIAEIVGNLAGGGKVVVRNGAIQHLNPAALAHVLKGVDKQADEDIEKVVNKLVSDAFVQKPFAFETGEAAFSIAGGNLRIGGMSAINADAGLRGDVRLNIVNLTIDGNAKISFEAGEDAIAGATPEVDFTISGPLEELQISRDVTLLSSFLTMRARERREREYLAQKEDILENQRLTRMVRLVKNRARTQARRDEENRLKLEEKARFKENKLLKELEEAEEAARNARLAIQEKQRRKEENKRREEMLKKQRQLEEEKELERQKADLKRRREAFDKQVREQRARAENRQSDDGQTRKLQKLAPPKEVQPTGTPAARGGSNLPGVFSNVEDKIGELLKNSQ